MEDYSLKFTLLSRYDLSFLSNPRDGMSRFSISVVDFMKKDYCMIMLHIDMNLSRILLYA